MSYYYDQPSYRKVREEDEQQSYEVNLLKNTIIICTVSIGIILVVFMLMTLMLGAMFLFRAK